MRVVTASLTSFIALAIVSAIVIPVQHFYP